MDFLLVKNYFIYINGYNLEKVLVKNIQKSVVLKMKAFWYNEERKNVCGLRIRQLRKSQKITQRKLAIMAQLAGYGFISESSIIKSELGSRFIPDYEVAIFAELLGTTPEYLLGLTAEELQNGSFSDGSLFMINILQE